MRTFCTVLVSAVRLDVDEDVAMACGFEIEPLSTLVRGSRPSETADSGLVLAIDSLLQGDSRVSQNRTVAKAFATVVEISVFLRQCVLGMPLNSIRVVAWQEVRINGPISMNPQFNVAEISKAATSL